MAALDGKVTIVTGGGTGIGTYTTGDILYASGANTLTKLGVGSTGDVLTVAAGVPTWSDSSSETTASNADDTGSATVNTGRLVYYDATDDGYKEANGTAAGTSAIAGVATETKATGLAINVAFNGRVSLALPATHSAVTRGDRLYLAQAAGGYVVPAADITYTAGYVQLAVGYALETKGLNAGGAILGIFNPVGLHAVVL